MINSKLVVVYKKNNHWFTGTINENKLRKRKQIKKLSDETSKYEYLTLKRWLKDNKIKEDSDSFLEKYKVQSLYIKKDEPKIITSKEPLSRKDTKDASKLFWAKLNKLCLRCSKTCKQSSRVTVVVCKRMSIDK
jgi:hypothetical protein